LTACPAYVDEVLIAEAKLGVVVASVVAGVLGFVILKKSLPEAAQ
jgi:Na+/H+ antiporter NhaA